MNDNDSDSVTQRVQKVPSVEESSENQVLEDQNSELNLSDKFESYVVDGSSTTNGSIKTYFVFLDLPRHVEFRVSDMPLLEEGTLMDFDLTIRSLKNPKKTIPIQGTHTLFRRVLKFGGKRPGLAQFLEWKVVK